MCGDYIQEPYDARIQKVIKFIKMKVKIINQYINPLPQHLALTRKGKQPQWKQLCKKDNKVSQSFFASLSNLKDYFLFFKLICIPRKKEKQ